MISPPHFSKPTDSEPSLEVIARKLAMHQRRWLPAHGLRRAAVAIPLLPNPRGLSVLLTQRTLHVPQHKGEICFPGGRVDPDDDNSLVTALREAWEEVGIHSEHVRILGKLDDCVSITRYRVRPFVIFIDEPDYPFSLQPSEVEELLLVPLSHLRESGNHEIIQGDSPNEPPGHRFYWHDNVIWGLTATILDQLLGVIFDRA